jgi:hypothetical protein
VHPVLEQRPERVAAEHPADGGEDAVAVDADGRHDDDRRNEDHDGHGRMDA